MYYNVSTLMGVTANAIEKTYSKELSEAYKVTVAQKKILLENLIKEFKKFISPTFTILTFDFVVANHELGYYNSIIINMDLTNQGYFFYVDVDTQNVKIYEGVMDYIRTAVECFFLFVTLLTLLHIFFYDYVYAKKLATTSDRDDFIIEMNNYLPQSLEGNIIKNSVSANMHYSSDPDSDLNNENQKEKAHVNNNTNFNNKRKKSVARAKTYDNRRSQKIKHRENLTKNWTWFNFFKSLLEIYLADILDIVRNIALFLSIILMIKWATYVIYILNNKDNISQSYSAYNVVLNFDFSDSIINISNQFKGYIGLMAVTAIFIFFRLIKVFEPIFPTLTIYIQGFRKSLSDILSFFMLFFLIIFGISLILYFYYSVEINEFNSLTFAFLNNLFFFIGTTDYNLVSKMFDKNASFTIFYFLAVGMFIKYAFVRILLAIILYNFEGLKYSKGNRYKCVSVSEFKETVNQDFFYGLYCQIRQLPNYFYQYLCCKSPKKQKKKNNGSPSKETVIKKDNQQEESFNLKNERSERVKAEPEIKIVNENNENNLHILKKSATEVVYNNDIVLAIDADIVKVNENFNPNNDLPKKPRKSISSINFTNNDEIGLSKKVLTLDDLRFIYSKYIENFEMISRNPYFDSPEDIERVNVYYEKKYEVNFKRNMMYLILMIFLILSILFNHNSPWRFGFKTLLDNMLYQKGYNDLTEINSSKTLDEFLINKIPTAFSKSKPKEGNDFFFLETSYLLGSRFFITKKRQQVKPESIPSDKIRNYEPITIEKNFKFEDKQNIILDSNLLVKQLIYDTKGSYSFASNGGLTADFHLDDFYRILGNGQSLNDTISDSFDNFVVMEFMIENLEVGIFAKYTIFSVFEYGYFYFNSFSVDILSKSFGSNFYGALRFIFILILLILIIYETFEIIREIKQLNNSYNKWFIKRKISTSVQAKVSRNYLNSEFIRKLRIIFNPIRASMFIILLLLYIYIILFLISLSVESKFYSLYENYSSNSIKLKAENSNQILLNIEKNIIYELKNKFTNISSFKDSYEKFSAFLLFFASLRIMFSLNIGKYFNAISQIAVKTLTKNLMIVILLFLMLPSFIFYSYLIFGVIDKSYKSFIESILSNFLKLFDFRNDLSNDISSGMKVLYVILFGFVMNLIILNLFVSIINSSYQKVKSKIFYSSENFSWIKVIFFCCNKKKMLSKTVGKEIIQNEIENFVKTHEAEPMFNLTAEFKSFQEFANYEIEKLKQVNESLSWIQNRTDLMQFSLICKDNSETTNDLTDNRFKNTDDDLMNLQYFAGLKYHMELMNSLEKDVLDIKESNYKLSVYLLNQNKNNDINDVNFKNEKIIKELLLLEKQYTDLISDIEELRSIKNDIEETNRGKEVEQDI